MDIKPCNILLKKDIIKNLEDAIEIKELINELYNYVKINDLCIIKFKIKIIKSYGYKTIKYINDIIIKLII